MIDRFAFVSVNDGGLRFNEVRYVFQPSGKVKIIIGVKCEVRIAVIG